MLNRSGNSTLISSLNGRPDGLYPSDVSLFATATGAAAAVAAAEISSGPDAAEVPAAAEIADAVITTAAVVAYGTVLVTACAAVVAERNIGVGSSPTVVGRGVR